MVLAKPEVFIGARGGQVRRRSGQCTDETTRKFVSAQMVAFEQWIAAVGRMRAPG